MGRSELGEVLDRALALCDRVGTSAQRAQILYGMQSSYIVAGRLEKSALITDDMARVFRETLGSEPPRSAFSMMAGVRLQMGRFREACDDFDDLVREADSSQLRYLQASQGLNYEVLARAWQSHALWCLGRPDTALERATQAHAPRASSSGSRSARRSPPPTWRCSSSSARIPPRSAGRRRRRSTSPRSSRRPTTARGRPSSSPTGRRWARRRRPASRVFETRSGLRGDGGAPPLAVLPLPARGRSPPEGGDGRGPRRRGGGPVPRAARRTSAGGTPSCIGFERSCCWPAAPSRPTPKRPCGAPSRSREGSRRGPWSCARPGPWPVCGRDRTDGGRSRPAGARLFVVHGRPRDPRSPGRAGPAFRSRLRAVRARWALPLQVFSSRRPP